MPSPTSTPPKPTTTPDTTLHHLTTTHLPAPTWTQIPTLSFQPHPNTTENSLLTQTLSNPTGVLAMQTHVHRPTPSSPVDESCLVFSLGSGVNGIRDTCHGGMIGLMLDEATGSLAAQVFGRYHIITAGLDVRYRKRLATPCAVLVRARIGHGDCDRSAEGRGKRKVVVEGTVEDAHGVVYATGKAVFVRIDPKGKL